MSTGGFDMATGVDQGAAYDRFARAVDGPLMILAVAFIPVLVVPVAMHLSRAVGDALQAADYTIWALFAVEYLVKLWLAGNRRHFLATHIPDLVVIAIPMLRPARAIRSLRLIRGLQGLRAVGLAGVAIRELRHILGHRKLHFVLLAVVVIVFLAASFDLEFERHASGSNIHNYPDALWWAVATVTTVGYGDHFPVSAAGRGVAVLLMVSGIALFGVLTATLASYFAQTDVDAAAAQLSELNARLERIEASLERISRGQPVEAVR